MTQGIQEQIGILPAIEPESHFVKISRKMFCADLVPRSHNAAFQKRESGLDCIGMNIALHINAVLMPDGLVLFGRDSGLVNWDHVAPRGNQKDDVAPATSMPERTGMIFCWHDHCGAKDPARRCELANLQRNGGGTEHNRGGYQEQGPCSVQGISCLYENWRRGRRIAPRTHRMTVTFASLAKPLGGCYVDRGC